MHQHAGGKEYVQLRQLVSSSTSNLGHAELGEFILQLVELLQQLLLGASAQLLSCYMVSKPSKRQVRNQSEQCVSKSEWWHHGSYLTGTATLLMAYEKRESNKSEER